MRLIKIFSNGKIIKPKLYEALQILDEKCFPGCYGEFVTNRDWWVIEKGNVIIAYCGMWYRNGICMFNRAWVNPNYRGQGLQKKMILTRLKAAKKYGHTVITYTTIDNDKSANNLISKGFKIYVPQNQYAGKDKLYFIKLLSN